MDSPHDLKLLYYITSAHFKFIFRLCWEWRSSSVHPLTRMSCFCSSPVKPTFSFYWLAGCLTWKIIEGKWVGGASWDRQRKTTVLGISPLHDRTSYIFKRRNIDLFMRCSQSEESWLNRKRTNLASFRQEKKKYNIINNYLYSSESKSSTLTWKTQREYTWNDLSLYTWITNTTTGGQNESTKCWWLC